MNDKLVFLIFCDDYKLKASKTVEQYDPFSDSWSKFPKMINRRCYHQSVRIKNKLFMIGGGITSCEVYDSTCKRFVAIKLPLNSYMKLMFNPRSAFSVGNRIFVFSNSSSVLCYDVDQNEWSEQSCGALVNLISYSCVKVPRM